MSENYRGQVDTLRFRLSDPSLPNSVIIGANGSAPLTPFNVPTSDDMVFVLGFKEAQGHVYIFYRYKVEPRIPDSAMRATHYRWGDPENEFTGLCSPL